MQSALDTHQAESHFSLFINNAYWSLAYSLPIWGKRKNLLTFFAVDTFVHTKKNKDSARPFWRRQTLMWESKSSFFPSYGKSIFRIHMKLSPPYFSPFSPPMPLLQYYSQLYVASIKLWKLRKPALIYSSKKYELLFLPLSSCKLIYKILN